MFNVGGGEFILIALVALLVLGPDKLPDFARKSARLLGQLRSMSQGFQDEMRGVMNFDDSDTPETSRGPRLVGPIDTGDGPVQETTTASSTGEPSGPAPTGSPSADAAGTGPTDGPSTAPRAGIPGHGGANTDGDANTGHGDDGTTSGTSAA